jgi:hypothetical protein
VVLLLHSAQHAANVRWFCSVLNSEAAWETLDPEDNRGRARLQLARADLIPPLFPAAIPEPEVPRPPRFPALEVYNSMLVQSVAHVPDTPIRLLAQNTQTSTELPNGDGQGYEIQEVFEQESEPAFFKLRKELVEHYSVRWGRGDLQWLRANVLAEQAAASAEQAARNVSFVVRQDDELEYDEDRWEDPYREHETNSLVAPPLASATTLTPPANFLL